MPGPALRRPRRRLLAMLLGTAAAAGGLGGCVAWTLPQTLALQRRRPSGLPLRVEWPDVPFHPQTPYHCGPAALATVLGHAGLPRAPEALAAAAFLPARQGTLQTEMLGAARRAGAWAIRLPAELEALLREVAAGHPVVVLQNLGLSFAPRWHYAVAVGYDLEAGEIVLRSGTTRREVMSLRSFEHTWARGGRWAIVALRPDTPAATATREDALAAAIGFERVAPPHAAAQAYESLVARWADDALAWLGLGNVRHAMADWHGAAAAFERSAALASDNPAPWINLSASRWQLGDAAGAGAAARQALELARRHAPELEAAAEAAVRRSGSGAVTR